VAKTSTETDGGKEPASGTAAFLLATALLTIFAVGAGFLAGHTLKDTLASSSTQTPTVTEAKLEKAAAVQLLQLPSIVTNLAGGKHWIRLDATVLLADTKPVEPGLANELSSDVSSLVRTLTLQQIDGPAGFQHLREELQDRLALRSGGRAKDITIQSMIIE